MTNQTRVTLQKKREAQRAEALRENLKRRKLQQKEQDAMRPSNVIQPTAEEASLAAPGIMPSLEPLISEKPFDGDFKTFQM